jgi:hypothetical protein
VKAVNLYSDIGDDTKNRVLGLGAGLGRNVFRIEFLSGVVLPGGSCWTL